MIIKELKDEDFVNYKKPSMFIGFPTCSFKCCKEGNLPIEICQNCDLIKISGIEISPEQIVERFLSNPITSAIVIGGMEPFDSFSDLLSLISTLRQHTSCDCVIYSGYTKEELENGWLYQENRNSNTRRMAYEWLKTFPNIIVKFGRFIPNQQSHYDEVLGVKLISNNQYAERVS